MIDLLQAEQIVVVAVEQAAVDVTALATIVDVDCSDQLIDVETSEYLVEIVTGGVPGAPGRDGDLSYVHVQSIPSATWVVVHDLNKFPSVSVIDSGGATVLGDVRYDSANQCTLTFAGGFSGRAFFN